MSRRVTQALINNKIKYLNTCLGKATEPIDPETRIWNIGSFTWEKYSAKNWQLCQIANRNGSERVIARFSSGYDLVEAIDALAAIFYNELNNQE